MSKHKINEHVELHRRPHIHSPTAVCMCSSPQNFHAHFLRTEHLMRTDRYQNKHGWGFELLAWDEN